MRAMSALMALGLMACTSAETETSMTKTTDGGSYVLDLVMPSPVVSGETEMEITLSDADGVALPGATVTVVPFMPMMGHGIEGDVMVHDHGAGEYHASWAYSMPGSWRLDIEVDGDGGVETTEVMVDVE